VDKDKEELKEESEDNLNSEEKKKNLKELGLDEDSKINLGYIPPNAKLNIDSRGMGSPDTIYEERKSNIDQNEVKKIAKGQYGNKNN
jgi:hypothetical protein